MIEDNNDIKESSAYQNSLIYIVLVMLALLQSAVICVAWGCYLPYTAFGFSIPNQLHRASWTLVMIPAVVIILCLWMANMLNKRLSSGTLLLTLIEGIFLVLVPRIYTSGKYNEVSYFTSGFAFFLALSVIAAVIWDLWGGRRGKKRYIAPLISLPVLVLCAAIIYYLTVLTVFADVYPRVVICFVMPVIMLLYFAASILSAFTSLFSKEAVGVSVAVSALGTLIVAFERFNYRALRLLFAVGVIVVWFVWIYDIIKYIKYKEK